MKERSSIIIISGPSGVGKKTVISELVKIEPGLLISVSATSRKPRLGEKEGIDYFFLSEEAFRDKIDREEFLEWAMVHGNYYGTLYQNFLEAKEKKTHLILEIDIQGGSIIKKKYPLESISIFLLPPSFSELEKRIRIRGTETDDQIVKRLETAKLELTHAKEYDYRVINSEPKLAAVKINDLIKGRPLK
jgi:guanylate kinase